MPDELEPLTTKPSDPIENGPAAIDLALELELTDLSDEEAAGFRDGPSVLEDVVLKLKQALGVIAFFTARRHGSTSVDASAR